MDVFTVSSPFLLGFYSSLSFQQNWFHLNRSSGTLSKLSSFEKTAFEGFWRFRRRNRWCRLSCRNISVSRNGSGFVGTRSSTLFRRNRFRSGEPVSFRRDNRHAGLRTGPASCAGDFRRWFRSAGLLAGPFRHVNRWCRFYRRYGSQEFPKRLVFPLGL